MAMSELHGHVGGPVGHAAHIASRDFALYVIDALARERAAEVEDHVARCEACAAALAREAQVELAMELLAAGPASCAAPAHPPLRSVAAPAPLARAHASARPAARSGPLPARRIARIAGGVAASLAAAALVALWIAPGSRIDTADDVARYGAVSADAAGALVSFDAKPRAVDALDGG
jgi:anti-sigma factor RsiW